MKYYKLKVNNFLQRKEKSNIILYLQTKTTTKRPLFKRFESNLFVQLRLPWAATTQL